MFSHSDRIHDGTGVYYPHEWFIYMVKIDPMGEQNNLGKRPLKFDLSHSEETQCHHLKDDL